jgi:hypothetical protein
VGWSGIAVLFNELASVCVLLVGGFVGGGGGVLSGWWCLTDDVLVLGVTTAKQTKRGQGYEA